MDRPFNMKWPFVWTAHGPALVVKKVTRTIATEEQVRVEEDLLCWPGRHCLRRVLVR